MHLSSIKWRRTCFFCLISILHHVHGDDYHNALILSRRRSILATSASTGYKANGSLPDGPVSQQGLTSEQQDEKGLFHIQILQHRGRYKQSWKTKFKSVGLRHFFPRIHLKLSSPSPQVPKSQIQIPKVKGTGADNKVLWATHPTHHILFRSRSNTISWAWPNRPPV